MVSSSGAGRGPCGEVRRVSDVLPSGRNGRPAPETRSWAEPRRPRVTALRDGPKLDDRVRSALSCCPADLRSFGPILFHKGAPLVSQGSSDPYVYLHLAGWARVEAVTVRGHLVVVDFLLAGDMSGLAQEEEAAFSVIAMGDVLALRFLRDRLVDETDTNGALRDICFDALKGSLARMRDLRVALTGRSAASKICCVLALLAERAAAASKGEPTIPISQLMLAHTVDLTPVAVNRTIQSLRRAGLLTWGPAGVRIFEPERLRAFASTVTPSARRRLAGG